VVVEGWSVVVVVVVGREVEVEEIVLVVVVETEGEVFVVEVMASRAEDESLDKLLVGFISQTLKTIDKINNKQTDKRRPFISELIFLIYLYLK
jgi:hypothetical protein